MRTISHVRCNPNLIAGIVLVFRDRLYYINKIKCVSSSNKTSGGQNQFDRGGELREITGSKESTINSHSSHTVERPKFVKGGVGYVTEFRQVWLLALVLVHNHTPLGVGVTSSSVRG